jgi:rhodanese-related sulfurtransferase
MKRISQSDLNREGMHTQKKHPKGIGSVLSQINKTLDEIDERRWDLIMVFLLSFVSTVVLINTGPSYITAFTRIAARLENYRLGRASVEVRGNEAYLHIDPVIIKEYIETHNATHILIDARSEEEYKNGHIKGAANIPLYTDFRHPYQSAVPLANWEKTLRSNTRGKLEIIIYGYRPDADLLLIAANMARSKKMPVKVLAISYNDWVGGFPQWLPGHEIYGSFNINDYIERSNP